MTRDLLPGSCCWLAVAALVLFAASGHGQDYVYATGNPNFGVQYPVPDGYINITNGNVHLNIPLGTFKQRGNLPPIAINLEYDSRIWQIVDNGGYSWQPTNVPNSNAGWRLVTGLENGNLSFSNYYTNPGSCGEGQPQQDTEEVFTDFVWTDGQGTKHTFQAELDQGLPMCGSTPSPASTSGWAIDDSGYSIYVTYDTNVNGDIQATIDDNRGNQVYPTVRDPYGNTASYTSGTITDSTNRTLLTTTNSGNTTAYKVLKEGGGYNTYTVTTEPISVGTAFNESAVSEYSGSLTAIHSIQFPDGSEYAFAYDSQGYGELTSMTLPTSGEVTFGYSNYEDSYQNENRWITSEGDGGGFAQFVPSVLTQCSSGEVGCQEQMELIRPGGYTRVYTLTLNDGAWDGKTVTYQGDTSSPAIMTVVNNYNFQSYQCPSESICYGAEYIAASCSQVTLNDTGQTAETLYSYDLPWLGRISSKKEYDYGASGSSSCTTTATPTRETDYTYSGDEVATKTVEDNGAPWSQTVYNYTSGPNPTSIVKGGVSSGPQTITSYVYDSSGMKTSETDPNGNITSYTYGCDDLYLTETTYPATTNGISHITQADPDCSSGLPITTTDENSQITNYGYDSYGRKSTVSYPDGGEVSYQYPSSSETTETRKVSSVINYTKTTTLDSWGRVSTVATSDPAGTATVTATHDGDNRVLCVTSPERSSSSTTDGQKCFSYDALNRPTEITQPDKNTIQVTYAGNQATVTDEDGNEKSYTYDAFHDLTKVMEPNSSGTLAWETDYTYDAGGHLLTVNQKGDGSRSVPERTFSYDDLGRLISEYTPETGTESYTYDSNGNTKTVTTGRGAITYDYDQLNRVISESGGSLDYTYTYDVASNYGFTSQDPIGRLVEASNMVNASEQFSYDSMGRVIDESHCIPTDCTRTGNAVYAGYDYAGDLTSLTYPDGRVMTMGFDSARHLTSVEYTSWNGAGQSSDYLSSASYDPTGQMTAATYGDGVQVSATFNNRLDATALSYQYNGQALWSKQYQWAADAKNLTQVDDEINPAQDYSYTYDTDNRLTSSSGGQPIETSPGTAASGWVSISGYEQSAYPCQTYCPLVYDSGTVYIDVNGSSVGEYGYGEEDTGYTIASGLATSINNNSSSPVTATAGGESVTLTSKATGTAANMTLSAQVDWNDPTNAGVPLFSSPSFSTSTSGSSLTGGTNPTYGGMTLAETYTPDPWGDVQESGNFSFTQGFTAENQVSGYTYDSAGDLTSDGVNAYSWNVDGTLASTESAQYTYDALEQRVEKTGGSNPGEFIYFNGMPVAMLNTSTGAWTDLIWAGTSMIAEVAGSETATPVYRLLDNEGSLVATVGASGDVTGTTTWAPYGQVIYTSASDPYGYAGLYGDTEYGGDHAWYRSLSTEQIRWLSPDPYNGSYNLMDPQSLNRYSYVDDSPLANTDPDGRSFGLLNGVGGSSCSGIGYMFGWGGSIDHVNPCNPVTSAALTYGVYEGLNALFGKTLISSTLGGAGLSAAEISPFISAGFTVFCSIDSVETVCGPSGGWTSVVFTGKNQWVGKMVNDTISTAGAVGFAGAAADTITANAVGEAAALGSGTAFNPMSVAGYCATGGFSDPMCDIAIGFGVYTVGNELFQVFWDLFGPPQFHGTLIPRAGDPNGLGTIQIGIPNHNLGVKELLGFPSRTAIPSPGMPIQ